MCADSRSGMMNGGRLSQSTAFMDAPPVSLALDTEETAGAADQAEPDLAVNIPEYPTLIAGSLREAGREKGGAEGSFIEILERKSVSD
jgi:hypothetical protein